MLRPNKIAAALLTLSLAGAGAIAHYEGTKTEAYLDVVHVPTICSGVTRGVTLGMKRTLQECEVLLQEEASYAGAAVSRCTTVPLTQTQYDALISFTYNVGGGAYCGSTLVRKLNAGDCVGAASEFKRWNRAGGRVIAGLSKRRASEAAQFIQGCS